MSAFIAYMEQCLGEAKYNTSMTEASWNCPFCVSRGETPDTRCRFSINTYTLRCQCFNCGYKGNAVTFTKDFNHVSMADAYDIVNFYEDFTPLSENVFEEIYDSLMLEDYEESKKVVPLPDDFIPLTTNTRMGEKFYNYAKGRHFSDKQIVQHGLGYCPNGIITDKTNLRNRLVMQVHNDEGKPIYWNARDITGKLKPKSLNPPKGLNTINKSDVLFNLNNAKKTGLVIVTEGIFDSIIFGEHGVALFGKTMSTKQLVQLIKSGVEDIMIALDPDAFREELKLAERLSKHFKNVYILHLEGDDANALGRKGVLPFLSKAERYDAFTKIKYSL